MATDLPNVTVGVDTHSSHRLQRNSPFRLHRDSGSTECCLGQKLGLIVVIVVLDPLQFPGWMRVADPRAGDLPQRHQPFAGGHANRQREEEALCPSVVSKSVNPVALATSW